MRIDTIKSQSNTKAISLWNVYMDRKAVGKIVQTDEGFQYIPKGQKASDGGEFYQTLPSCVDSLRG